MEFLKFIRFDIMAALILIFSVIRSSQRNQRKVWRGFLCLLFALGITGCLVYFDLGGLATKFFTLVNQYVEPLIAKLLNNNTELLERLRFSIWTICYLIVVLVVYLLLKLIVVLITGSETRRMKRNPNYAPMYNPVGAAIGGLFRGVLVVLIFYIGWSVVASVFPQLTTDGDFVFPYINQYLPLLQKIKDIMVAVLGA